jgi:hypothetical protein
MEYIVHVAYNLFFEKSITKETKIKKEDNKKKIKKEFQS